MSLQDRFESSELDEIRQLAATSGMSEVEFGWHMATAGVALAIGVTIAEARELLQYGVELERERKASEKLPPGEFFSGPEAFQGDEFFGNGAPPLVTPTGFITPTGFRRRQPKGQQQ